MPMMPVERGADLMAHVGEKLGLEPGRLQCQIARLGEFGLSLLAMFDFGNQIAGGTLG